MACYISSTDNRFYVALEQSYGTVPAMTGANRFPAVKLTAQQQTEKPARRDKTGGRTFVGLPAGLRRQTSFGVKTYLTSWTTPGQEPGYGPLFQAALGGAPAFFAGSTVSAAPNASTVTLAGGAGLSPGRAITIDGEMRFVEALVDAQTVLLNAPLSKTPAAGVPVGPTASYSPAGSLRSVSIFDCWSPGGAVQRILNGAAVDKMKIRINGDFHEFEFQGGARDLIDSASFEEGQGGLMTYPMEPEVTELSYSLVPGHLGQAWLGAAPSKFYTLTEAEVSIDNDLDFRAREFGSATPRCISAGVRKVSVSFSLYSNDAAATNALYQAARQSSPVGVMFQLGQQEGQMFGVYMKAVKLDVPQFEDSERRLQWQFTNCRAEGTLDDEIFVAFG